MGVAISKSGGNVEKLRQEIEKLGNNTSTQRQINYMEQLGRAADRVSERVRNMHQNIRNGAANLVEKAPQIAAGAWAAEKVVAAPVKAYANLEQAQTDLKVALTNSKGQLSPMYGAINKEAVALGSQLPGSSKDFLQAALALKTAGTPESVIANGGLRSSAYLGVLLHMNQEQAALMVAKTREAFGLKEHELVPAANAMQKARFAFGLSPEDMYEANRYMAPTLTGLGWGGMERMQQVLAIEGMASQNGIDRSVFGTHFSDFLTRLSMMDTRLAKKGKEATEVRAMMKKHGIGKFEVFGSDGNMVSPIQVAEQMQQFKRMSKAEQVEAFHSIFGVQGSDIARLLMNKGPEGLQQALATQNDQADLNLRLQMSTETLQNKFENLTGNMENFNAALGKTIEGPLKKLVDKTADVVGGPVTNFVNEHPVASGAGWLGASAGAGYLGYKTLGSVATWLRGGGAAAEAVGAGGVAGSVGGLGAASKLGIYAAGAWGAYQIGRLGLALNDLYDANHHEGAQLTPEARGRLQYLNRDHDWLSMTAPPGRTSDDAAHLAPTLQVGQGVLKVEVQVNDNRVSATAVPFADMPLLRIDAGHTNPGGY